MYLDAGVGDLFIDTGTCVCGVYMSRVVRAAKEQRGTGNIGYRAMLNTCDGRGVKQECNVGRSSPEGAACAGDIHSASYDLVREESLFKETTPTYLVRYRRRRPSMPWIGRIGVPHERECGDAGCISFQFNRTGCNEIHGTRRQETIYGEREITCGHCERSRIGVRTGTDRVRCNWQRPEAYRSADLEEE